MKLQEFLQENTNLNKYSFGEFIKQRRLELKLKRVTVAQMLNVTPGYIADIEKGNRHAPLSFLKQLEELLQIEADSIIDFEDLAYQSHETCSPDLIQYLIANKEARNALRKEINGKNTKNEKAKSLSHTTFNPYNLTFGEYVVYRRENLDISLRKLASMIGISAAYLHEIEIGKKHAPVKHMKELIKSLQIPTDQEKDFEDLAYLTFEDCAEYITSYMLNDRNARVAIRYLIENKISGEKLLNVVTEIEKN